MDQRPWYDGFFGADYLRIFSPVLPDERTAAEVNAVVERLGLPPEARLLDLCCGQGRHAGPLARLGYRVTGLDRSRRLLEEAAGLAAGQGQRVGLVEGDMRRLPFADASFDAVLNLFNAFGYLEDDAQDELALHEVARVLRPGGRFLQELANREALVRGWHDSDVVRHDDGLVVLQERTFDLRTSRDLVRYTLRPPSPHAPTSRAPRRRSRWSGAAGGPTGSGWTCSSRRPCSRTRTGGPRGSSARSRT